MNRGVPFFRRAGGRPFAYAAPRSRAALRSSAAALLWAAGMLAAFALPGAALGQEPKVLPEISIGFRNLYKLGAWTPLEVKLQGGAERTVGVVGAVVLDGDGVPSETLHPTPVQLLPGETRSVALTVRIGRANAPVRLFFDWPADAPPASRRRTEWIASEGSVPPLPPPLSPMTPFVVSLGPALGLEAALKAQGRGDRFAPRVAALAREDLPRLPDSDLGWDGVDWALLTSPAVDFYQAVGPAQSAALKTWIARGGRACLTLGAGAAETAAPRTLPGDLLPGSGVEVRDLAVSRALEEYARSESPLLRPGLEKLRLAVLEQPRGTVQAAERGVIPIVVFSPREFGEVRFCGLDLNAPEIRDWKGLPRLWATLLDLQAPEGTADADAEGGAYLQERISDLSTDLLVGLEKFPSVREVEPWAVGVFLTLYIVCIGPVDYYLVRRVLQRPEWTWATFPVWIVLASAGAFFLARFAKGTELLVNEAAVLDVDLESGRIRGQTWFNLYSPSAGAFDLQSAPLGPSAVGGPAVKGLESRLAWFGSPEADALGGMGGPAGAPGGGGPPTPEVDAPPYQVEPARGMQGAPILYHSTRAFLGSYFLEGSSPVEMTTIGVGLNRAPESVEVVNRFDVPLQSVRLIVGQDGYEFGDLAPGERRRSRLSQLDRRGVKERLTKMRQVLDREANVYRYQWAKFEAGGGDLGRTLEVMMFHDLLEGRKYTGLHHGDPARIDLSFQLACGRIMLLGEIERPIAELVQAGKPLPAKVDRRRTVVRVLAPWNGGTATAKPADRAKPADAATPADGSAGRGAAGEGGSRSGTGAGR